MLCVGGCSSTGRAGWIVIERALVQIPALGWAELSRMSKCPWARYWNPNCSWSAIGTLHGGLCRQWGPCDELVTHPGSTLPSPRDSWDWLQQKPLQPQKRDEAVTDNGWMDGNIALRDNKLKVALHTNTQKTTMAVECPRPNSPLLLNQT